MLCTLFEHEPAQKAETAVWNALSALLTDPESLRRDLEVMIEREKEARGDLEPEAKAWATTLLEAKRKREKCQEMYAVDAMTIDELKSRLDTLEETSETARRELGALASWRESLKARKSCKDRLLQLYDTLAPGALAPLDQGERPGEKP